MGASFRMIFGRAVCVGPHVRRQPRETLFINNPALQSALLQHLVMHRGVRAQARQLVILPSAQAAIELVARVVLDAGELA